MILGRGGFFARDPLSRDYPWNSPYAFSENDPINFIDLEGLEKSPTAAQMTQVISKAARLGMSTGRDLLIFTIGYGESIMNANSIGAFDGYKGFTGTETIHKFASIRDQRMYTAGRITGDVAAMIQGGSQMKFGGGLALTTGGETLGAGAVAGGVVALHGAGVGITAELDLLKRGARFLSMSNSLNDKGSSEGNGNAEGKKDVGELRGKEFEDHLTDNLQGGGSGFQKGGRDFDGSYKNGKVWFEAKSGNFWKDITSTEKGLAKFKSDMGSRLKIAKDNGKTYELFSNSKIPDNIKTYLDGKGIKYTEVK